MKLPALIVIACGAGCIIGGESPPRPGAKDLRGATDGDDHVNVQVGMVWGPVVPCSGTLIRPRVVLTAAHCFPDRDAVRFESEGFVTDVLDIQLHPLWPTGVHPDDIAIVLLRDPAPFAPAPFDGIAAVVGSRPLVVGYGTTDSVNGLGTRRSGTVRLTDVDDMIDALPDPSATCGGDSGGGLFEGGRLIGVTSGGWCEKQDGSSYYTRVDRHLGFIDEWVTAWGQNKSPPLIACGFLQAETTLQRGQSVWACNNQSVLSHQVDGNAVLYHLVGGILTPVWATDTYGLVSDRLTFQSDGNLVLYGPDGALWASGTYGNPNAFALVNDNGNLAIYAGLGNPIWSTNTPH